MPIQTIIFDRRFWLPSEAKKWIRQHNYHPIKPMHATNRFYRFRINNPVFNRYRTITLPIHVELVVGFD